MKRSRSLALSLAVAGSLVLGACGSSGSEGSGGSGGDTTLSIVGFAVPEAANKAIAEEFNKTPEGEGVKFKTSYGASGDQSRAVESGLKADYVHFSVPSDVTRLVEADLVAEDWNSGETKGIVSTSVVVFGVREGNPLGIEDWDDLTKEGVEIVTPNPASSGAARWNALAAWGQVLEAGGTEEEAEAYVTDLYNNAVALPSSGRDATTAFTGGTGNVFLTYENEAILARQNGQKIDYVIPPTTLLIENPGAILTEADPKAQDWLDFVLSEEGQTQFALKGFRPLESAGVEVDEVEGAEDPSDPFPAPETLLTVEETFGGWSEVSDKFFDEDTGIVTDIIAKTGKGE
ncbi:sulfate ABC transporter substrate-binding protein [Aquihabitans daechungensis]|uniref:sulfate ABC transporter substrate-binding protein n=1 Tax=Aquihabitans daechungensis TaxID=1052257 RepID=UPI003B9F4F7B